MIKKHIKGYSISFGNRKMDSKIKWDAMTCPADWQCFVFVRITKWRSFSGAAYMNIMLLTPFGKHY